MSIEKLIRNLDTFKTTNVAVEVFKRANVQTLIINYNRQEQLFAQGIDIYGNIVGFYSLTTSLINPSKRVNTPYNFKDTGEFFRSFKVIVEEDGFVIDADADKLIDSEIIESEQQILGLTKESKEKLVQMVLPSLIDQVRKQILA
jgi:hypothetical protein